MPVENSRMNDRIFTLLDKLELSNHILTDNNGEKINEIINGEIDYARVDLLLREHKINSEKFLINALRDIHNED